MNRSLRRALVPLCASLVAATLGAQSVDAILSRHLQAMGGADKLHAIHALRLKGTLQTAQGLVLPLTIEEARPGKSRFEARAEGVIYLRIFDGTKGWISDPSTNGILRPFTAAELQAESRGTFDGELVDLQARGARAELAGRLMWAGRDTYQVKVTEKDGATSLHWVDAEMFLEFQRERDVDTPEGRRTEVLRFSDFRVVEGVPMAFRVQMGQKFSHSAQIIQLSEAQVNPAIPDSDFEAPAAR
ncbi:MAG TPA: hypothetical protein VL181_02935 [Holophagaceae bacterium]|nr:hypothetical protein [Holophagaceae bacterium]